MSVISAIDKLAQILYAVDPSPEDPPREGCIFGNPREAVSIGDFPSIVITQTPGATHTWSQEALGLGLHNYTLTIYVFLGFRQTSVSELHARSLPWSEAIMRVLSANINMGGVVNQIGFGTDPRMFTYRIGPIPWGTDGNGNALVYWGLMVTLPVVDKPEMDMGGGS